MTKIYNGQSLLSEPMPYAELVETEEGFANEAEQLANSSSLKFLESELATAYDSKQGEAQKQTAGENEKPKSTVLRRTPISQRNIAVSRSSNGVRRCGRLSEY
jgi:hypothetical protein